MLAHTTYRHLMIGSQLAVGIVLLSASYFSDEGFSAANILKADSHKSNVTAPAVVDRSKQC